MTQSEYEYDVFLICPIKDANLVQKAKMEVYIAKLECEGKNVYYPADDTDQNDDYGYRICMDNAQAISNSAEVHIFFDPTSKGSLFDLGVAFALGKPLVIVNPEEVERTEKKSFNNMIQVWNDLSLE